MCQAWKSWLIYMVSRRTKLHMKTTALEFRSQSVLCFWWSKWRWRLGQAHAEHALHAVAVKHRALSLQLQGWLRWQEQLLISQRDRRKEATAVQHYQHWQKQRSLKAWLKYLQICRVKRWQNEMAVQFHHGTVLQIHFCDWQWAWEWRQSLSAHQALVVKLAGRMVLRRAFTHWKHYMLLQAEEAAQHEAAAEHRQHYLLYSCSRAFKDNVTQARLQQIRKKLAQQLRDTTLLHRFWHLWLSRIEQREEREQTPSLHAALSHHRVTVLHKCVKVWLRYVHKRRWQQLLRARADGHFQQSTACCLLHVVQRLAMAPAETDPAHKSSAFPQRDIREASICSLEAEDVSASRKLLGRENGYTAGRAAAFA